VRNLVVSVEDHFPAHERGYRRRSRSAVVLAVGSPQDILQEKVVAELRERLSAVLLGQDAPEPSVAVFAGHAAMEQAEFELAGRDELGLTRADVRLLDAGAWIVASPPGGALGEAPAHRVQIVDAPLRDEVVVALRGGAELDLR
jgi:hypothetical protein